MLGKALQTAAAGSAAGAGAALGVEDVFSTWLYTGNGGTQTITNGIALADGVDILPGTALGGGFFAGFISSTADGVATHALIVAPKASGESASLQWQTSSSTTGATSPFDGAANTALMTNSPAANFCTGLTIGGYSDWYLPARYELDIAYFHLKPTTASNSTGWGINDYSVPKRTANYTTGDPARTSIAAFQNGGSEAFVANSHWSSTEDSATLAWRLNFNNGDQLNTFKNNIFYVRAFRKIPINDPLLDAYRVTGEGGLVWIKSRSSPQNSVLVDNARGIFVNGLSENTLAVLESNTSAAQQTNVASTLFSSSGFTTKYANTNGVTYASWTFRKAEKFFDIVTYTGNGTLLTLNHNLGSTPGCIIVKRTDSTGNWPVYHRSLSTDATVYLNSNGSAVTRAEEFGSVTSTTFQVGDGGGGSSQTNASGATYVAYLFAHDAGGFGDDGTESVIKCGSYTGSASPITVDLGWEPQWVLVKRATGSSTSYTNWAIFDNMRGVATGGSDVMLAANLSTAEGGTYMYPATNLIDFTSTGFVADPTAAQFTTVNSSGETFVYIAIRRGPMKKPTDATKLFYANAVPQADKTDSFGVPFPPDLVNTFSRNGSDRTVGFNQFVFADRLRGLGVPNDTFNASAPYLISSSSGAENAINQSYFQLKADGQNITRGGGWNTSSYGNYIFYFMRRAPGFFDVVAWTASASTSITHGLGVVPELIIAKSRSVSGEQWPVYTQSGGRDKTLFLNLTNPNSNLAGYWGTSGPTSTAFRVAAFGSANNVGNMIAYLFASCPGVSKVGSYTGTGTTLNIDCGFTNGARFVLIKRASGTGDWYVWDTARGIVSGDDPYLWLNSTAAEATNSDYIDPLASGFQISSSAPTAINASGSSFIFLAIA